MVNISYACLIYKSTKWLKFVYEQFHKYTNMTDNEFYFVANDANPQVLGYLKDNNIPHYIHNNTEEQRKEWYINNVYRAWNTAGRMAKGKYVVFINSDMAFTSGWADRLLESVKDNMVVTSRLVERGILSSGLYGIEANFGNVPEDYNEAGFLQYAKSIEAFELRQSGLYMPIIIEKKHLEMINYYPEGNIVPDSDIFNPTYAKLGEPCLPGDQVFMKKLKFFGIEHWTNFASIVYHFQQGEMLESEEESKKPEKVYAFREVGQEHREVIASIAISTNCISYLELGLYDGHTFSLVANFVPNCVGVDIKDLRNDKKRGRFYQMTTDAFFEQNKENYNIIFIDADHSFESVKKDFENSLKILTQYGIIFLHDTDPMMAKYLAPGYCNDCYKITDYITLNHPELEMVTLPCTEAGLTIVKRKKDKRVLNH